MSISELRHTWVEEEDGLQVDVLLGREGEGGHPFAEAPEDGIELQRQVEENCLLLCQTGLVDKKRYIDQQLR